MSVSHKIRTVLITGGGSGIGYAAAQLFFDADYRVFLLGRTQAKIESAVRSFPDTKRLRGYIADVSDVEVISKLFSDWEKEGVSPDILINNAGVVIPIGRLTETSPDKWFSAIKINLYGAYLCSRQAIPPMLKKGGGTIINISSGAASYPLEGWSAYCSSKAGLAMLTSCLHHEYGDAGIRVFGYRPGAVDTPMQETIRSSGINPVSQIKRENLLSSDEIVKGFLYLAEFGDEYRGKELDIRDQEFREKVFS